MAALCRSTYFQLHQIRPIARSLPLATAKALIQALLFRRLDYCNALLFGVSDTLVRRLQSVQNAAARLITGTRRRDHITPVLYSLHWLPVQRRIDYKMAVLVCKALRGQLPSYLSDSVCVVTWWRRSARDASDLPMS